MDFERKWILTVYHVLDVHGNFVDKPKKKER